MVGRAVPRSTKGRSPCGLKSLSKLLINSLMQTASTHKSAGMLTATSSSYRELVRTASPRKICVEEMNVWMDRWMNGWLHS